MPSIVFMPSFIFVAIILVVTTLFVYLPQSNLSTHTCQQSHSFMHSPMELFACYSCPTHLFVYTYSPMEMFSLMETFLPTELFIWVLPILLSFILIVSILPSSVLSSVLALSILSSFSIVPILLFLSMFSSFCSSFVHLLFIIHHNHVIVLFCYPLPFTGGVFFFC